MKARLIAAALVLAALPTASASAVETADDSLEVPEVWEADFEGVEIDLRDGWDGARACNTDGITTECWDSEAEMLLALTAQGLSLSPSPAPSWGQSAFKRQHTCPTFLRLYSGSGYGGQVLAIATRYVVLNLSSFGFNNVTSSYRIGGCASGMWDGDSAGGSAYTGPMGAGVSASSMLPGWDNRISSVYQG